MYITRAIEPVIERTLKTFKVMLLTGARQVGKSTTLHYLLGNSDYEYVTLDDYHELEMATSDPKLFFLNHPGKLIIDEIQYAPDLFREIKYRVDQKDVYGQYVLTGSQTFSLLQGVTETLAGRIGIVRLNGLSMREILGDPYAKPVIPDTEYLEAERKQVESISLWEKMHRGSLPELTKLPQLDTNRYYASYVSTYLERDVRTITKVKDLGTFSQFVRVLAARVAQEVNYEEIAREIGIDQKTVKSWISILETSGLVILVPPFLHNRLSRVIKRPVLYFFDTGLVAHLLRWLTPETMMTGAMSGPLLQNYAVSEIVKSFHNAGVVDAPVYYYRDKDQREIDLIVESSGILYPIEIKKSASPNAGMGRHFQILQKADGFAVGNQLLLSQVEKKRRLAQDLIAYPIGEI